MTAKQKLLNWFVEHGLSRNEAERLFEQAKPTLERDFPPNWESPADEYHDAVYALWELRMRRVASGEIAGIGK
jgi:hypothetical protein